MYHLFKSFHLSALSFRLAWLYPGEYRGSRTKNKYFAGRSSWESYKSWCKLDFALVFAFLFARLQRIFWRDSSEVQILVIFVFRSSEQNASQVYGITSSGKPFIAYCLFFLCLHAHAHVDLLSHHSRKRLLILFLAIDFRFSKSIVKPYS